MTVELARDSGSAQPLDGSLVALDLREKIDAMLPAIRARSQTDEQAGQVSSDTLRELEAAGVFEMLVPRIYGGHGLGLAAFYPVVRILARADLATAWTVSFLIEHNWWAARLPLAAQKEMFAGHSHVKVATAQSTNARGERVPGGVLVTGEYPYSSAILHSGWCIYPALVQGEIAPLTCLEDVVIRDDWKIAAMSATGSRTGVVEGKFVPDYRTISMLDYFGSNHPGKFHEEPIYRARLIESIAMQMAALAVGGAEAMVELGRARLFTSAPLGVKRIDREASRIRWAHAMQKVRAASWPLCIIRTQIHGSGLMSSGMRPSASRSRRSDQT